MAASLFAKLATKAPAVAKIFNSSAGKTVAKFAAKTVTNPNTGKITAGSVFNFGLNYGLPAFFTGNSLIQAAQNGDFMEELGRQAASWGGIYAGGRLGRNFKSGLGKTALIVGGGIGGGMIGNSVFGESIQSQKEAYGEEEYNKMMLAQQGQTQQGSSQLNNSQLASMYNQYDPTLAYFSTLPMQNQYTFMRVSSGIPPVSPMMYPMGYNNQQPQGIKQAAAYA